MPGTTALTIRSSGTQCQASPAPAPLSSNVRHYGDSMKSLNSILLGLVYLCISGCVNPNKIYFENLSSITNGEEIYVVRDISYKHKNGIFNFESGIRKGKYTAIYKNDIGTFYSGNGFCTFSIAENEVNDFTEGKGGFWLSNDQSKKDVRLFGMQLAVRRVKDGQQANWDSVIIPLGIVGEQLKDSLADKYAKKEIPLSPEKFKEVGLVFPPSNREFFDTLYSNIK